MIFEACRPFDGDALQSQALELALRRGGLRTLTLSVATDPARLGRALRALQPAALVLTGRSAPMDVWGRLVYAARAGERPVAVFDYRGALPDTGASTVGRLGDAPLEARDRLLNVLRELDRARPARPSEPAPAVPASAASTA
jgi:hypothetical protein